MLSDAMVTTKFSMTESHDFCPTKETSRKPSLELCEYIPEFFNSTTSQAIMLTDNTPKSKSLLSKASQPHLFTFHERWQELEARKAEKCSHSTSNISNLDKNNISN